MVRIGPQFRIVVVVYFHHNHRVPAFIHLQTNCFLLPGAKVRDKGKRLWCRRLLVCRVAHRVPVLRTLIFSGPVTTFTHFFVFLLIFRAGVYTVVFSFSLRDLLLP